MSIWECIELLNEFVDESDPDLDEPQIEHLLQTAEAIRKDYPEEDWLHLTGLIHDLGKVLLHPSFGQLPQWAVVGDTFPVGCAFDECNVHHKVAKGNKTSLPLAGLFIIRYHSFYPLHKHGAYQYLMNEEDKENLKWLHVFNKYDLYSKSKVRIDVEKVKPYYLSLIEKLNLGGLSLRQDDTATSFTQPPRPTTASEDEHLVSKIHAILDAVADRAEMHAIIGAQRNDWNHLFTNSINAISLTASLMAGISSIPVGEAAPHMLAFKLSSVILFTAATGMMLITSKIQPSQLAEEQRNATRLWEQLGRSIETTLALRAPTQRDVDEAMEKVLALDKAYPLPLLPGMLEKFPEIVEPTRWWPKIQPKQSPQAGGNGWSHELEGEMRGILRVLKAKDEQQYTTLGKLLLNMNKTLAISGPLLAGLAAISSGLIGSPALGPMPAFLGVIGGVLATAVHTLEHGGQVGMVFELFRNCAGYYRRLQEEIASNLGETDVQKRENGELFEMKVALQLGRSLSDLKGLASYASPLCEDEDIKEFAGKLF
ncbi:F-box protein [Musa troglodytarum]|uniref:inositol oxygenase n=1 Tax=Musa troglodytarum TaxID=320322 RepID=A0A9E7GF99_9LILI|nr:F-box protein [Musa troglodytarum]